MTDEAPKLTRKQQVFIDEYLQCFNASEAARRAGYTSKANVIGSQLLANPSISAEVQVRLAEIHMSADEALARETEIGRVGIGFFFKITDEWMFNPLPEYEILDEREIIDDTKEPPEKHVSYRVRHAVLDMDKVIDPRYAHLVKKFTNSRKTGLSIELYDGQTVHNNVLKMAGKFTDRLDLSNSDGSLKPEKEIDDERFDRAVSTLADAIRESISGTGGKQNSDVDTAK